MSNLGAMVRNVFYDKRTQVLYSLEGQLNRRYSLIEDPDYLHILRYEIDHNLWYATYIPHSLEYLAKIYKYLIQNIIEPEIDVDMFKNILNNVIGSTFGMLTVDEVEKMMSKSDQKKMLNDKMEGEYRKFGHTLQHLAEEYRKYKPQFGSIAQDMSDYTLENDYNDPVKRNEAIKKILKLS
jgi:hypothetical protein